MNKIVTGLGGGTMLGMCLAIPVALVAWGAAVYFSAVFGAGLAASIGITSVVGGVVGGLTGLAVLGPVSARVSSWAVVGGMAAVGTTVGVAAALTGKAIKTTKSCASKLKSKIMPKKTQPEADTPAVSKNAAQPASKIAEKSVRGDFKDTETPKQSKDLDLQKSPSHKNKGPKR